MRRSLPSLTFLVLNVLGETNKQVEMYQCTDTPFKFITSTVVAIDSQTTIPFTLKNLIKVLLPVTDKWKDLGEILCVTENILDEIFTNNEAHEACLREC